MLCALQEPPVLPGLLYQQLQQPSASSRITASLTVLHWLQLVAEKCRDAAAQATAQQSAAEDPAAASTTAAAESAAVSSVSLCAAISAQVPEALPDTCLMYLGAPSASCPSPPTTEPYSELSPLYARMRKDLYALVNASLQVCRYDCSHFGVLKLVELDSWVV